MSDIVKKTDALVLTNDQKKLIKNTVAQGCSDDELQLFFYQCERTKLDPFSRQIHMVKRGAKATIQTGIDGFRAIAERSGNYAGNDEYLFNGGLTEFECSVKKITKPHTATSTIKKVVGGVICEFTASASWDAYCPKGSDFMWKKMPFLMLGKCAEALALRKAFPNDMSGLYTDDEMSQSEVVSVKAKTVSKTNQLKESITKKFEDNIGHYHEAEEIEVEVKKEKKEVVEEETTIDKIRTALKSKLIEDEIKDKVSSWIKQFNNISEKAAKECLGKLEKIIEDGKKEEDTVTDEDIPF